MSFLIHLSTRLRVIAHADAYNKSGVKVRSERKFSRNSSEHKIVQLTLRSLSVTQSTFG